MTPQRTHASTDLLLEGLQNRLRWRRERNGRICDRRGGAHFGDIGWTFAAWLRRGGLGPFGCPGYRLPLRLLLRCFRPRLSSGGRRTLRLLCRLTWETSQVSRHGRSLCGAHRIVLSEERGAGAFERTRSAMAG